jgi:hypothetical protein
MTRDVCFCGWRGEMADREPIYAGDGEWGLLCPTCGHLDRLIGWPEAARHWTLSEAARRRDRLSSEAQDSSFL